MIHTFPKSIHLDILEYIHIVAYMNNLACAPITAELDYRFIFFPKTGPNSTNVINFVCKEKLEYQHHHFQGYQMEALTFKKLIKSTLPVKLIPLRVNDHPKETGRKIRPSVSSSANFVGTPSIY